MDTSTSNNIENIVEELSPLNKSYCYEDLPERIRFLYENGIINLLPIIKGTKKPAVRKWKKYQKEKFPIDKLKKHKGNFALITGAPLGPKDTYISVVDLDDPKLFKHFQHIDTFQVKTPKKGYQLIIESDKCLNDKKYFEKEYGLKIDYLDSEKFYALLPPSYVEYKNKNNELFHSGNHQQLSKHNIVEGKELFLHVKDGRKFVDEILSKAGFERNSGEKKTVREEIDKNIHEIIQILKDAHPKENRQDYALCIAGTLKEKAGFREDATEEIIKGVFDDEIKQRLQAVEYTYSKETRKLQGWGYLKKYLNEFQQEKFLNAICENSNLLKDKIIRKLQAHKYPTRKELTDYLSLNLNIYKDHNTLKYYLKEYDNSLKEINSTDIVKWFNHEFGVDAISPKLCEDALKGISNSIEKDYNLIEFNNGILNTETKQFIEDKSFLTKVPKLFLPLDWNPNANGGLIKKVIDETLDNDDYPNDKKIWFRSVGHMFMGTNRIGKHVIVQGPSKSGKSTLSTILKRLLNHSVIPIIDICKNERFTLYPMIDKDVNIDDDINNGVIKGIGFLNSVTTGNEFDVEVKGENKRVKAKNQQIPRLYSNGNSLLPVVGEGFDTRVILIHAMNVKPKSEQKDDLQPAILNGEYDKELEWLVYNAIHCYWDNMDTPIIDEESEAEMNKAYEMKSNPIRRAISELFTEDWNSTLDAQYVNRLVKVWLKIKYKEGKISKEHRKAGQKRTSYEMDKAGYDKSSETVNDECYRTTVWKYEDIAKTKLAEDLSKYTV